MGKITNFIEVAGIILWDAILAGIIYLGMTMQLDHTETGNPFSSGFIIALVTVLTIFVTYEIGKKNITEES